LGLKEKKATSEAEINPERISKEKAMINEISSLKVNGLKVMLFKLRDKSMFDFFLVNDGYLSYFPIGLQK
jgi:hypothetical protein